jgi:pyruvate-formate lyase-activating enzyme
MPEQSSMHAFLNWTKERIDEMDATLASLEAKGDEVKADVKAKADKLFADLKKRRDAFQANVKAQAQANDAALQAAKVQLETQWTHFEAEVKAYFATVGKQIEQQQATFQGVAAAQAKAWHEAADKLREAARKVAGEQRAGVDVAINKMKADTAETEARLQKLKDAGDESWTALSGALSESRKAFDRANQHAWDAIKHAAS